MVAAILTVGSTAGATAPTARFTNLEGIGRRDAWSSVELEASPPIAGDPLAPRIQLVPGSLLRRMTAIAGAAAGLAAALMILGAGGVRWADLPRALTLPATLPVLLAPFAGAAIGTQLTQILPGAPIALAPSLAFDRGEPVFGVQLSLRIPARLSYSVQELR